MKQRLSDIPETEQEAESQKRPPSLTVILMVIGLIAAFIVFFGPAFMEYIRL